MEREESWSKSDQAGSIIDTHPAMMTTLCETSFNKECKKEDEGLVSYLRKMQSLEKRVQELEESALNYKNKSKLKSVKNTLKELTQS